MSASNIVQFRIPPDDMAHFNQMVREAGYSHRNEFAKSLLLAVIADDRAAHSDQHAPQPQQQTAQ